jgi:DNA-binding HxlR family transcriptional regulator
MTISDPSFAQRPTRPPGPESCGAEDWLAFLGHRWNAMILWHLSEGSLRYGALQDRLPGISPKVLSERLAGLVARGLVARQAVRAAPPEVHYALTQKGKELREIIAQLYEWAENSDA